MNILPTLERFGLVKALPRGIVVEPAMQAATTVGRPSWAQNALTDFNPFFKIPQTANLRLYEQLVETIPIINAALERITQLVGCPKVESVDEAALSEFNDWWMNLKVNRVQRGGGNWFAGHCTDHLTYGRAHAEIILAASGRDIFGLQELHTRTIELRPRKTYGVDLVQQAGFGMQGITLPADRMLSTYHDLRNDSPQGNSLLCGLPFVGEIYSRMLTSLRNQWERYGVPCNVAIYKPPTGPNSGYSDPTGVKGREIARDITAQLEAIAASKAEGETRDVALIGDIELSILGAAGEILEISIPGRHILEQIVAKTGLPPMMLGLQWQQGERIGAVQASLVGEMIDEIREHMEASLRYLFSLRMLLVGRVFDYQLGWEAPSLMDAAEQAKADLLAAQAKSADLKFQERLWTLGINKAEDVARSARPELEGKTDAQVRDACPALLAEPPMMPMMMEPGQPGEPGQEGGPPRENAPFGRSLDTLYSAKAFGNGNGH